jgi:hypothetical protein
MEPQFFAEQPSWLNQDVEDPFLELLKCAFATQRREHRGDQKLLKIILRLDRT